MYIYMYHYHDILTNISTITYISIIITYYNNVYTNYWCIVYIHQSHLHSSVESREDDALLLPARKFHDVETSPKCAMVETLYTQMNR